MSDDKETDKKAAAPKAKRGYRKRIEQSIEHAEFERQKALARRRVELVRHGIESYDKRKITDAVLAFKQYLKTLETMKGVGEGQLTPAHFDLKKDLAELLLLNGVYWDLMKIYDQTTQAKSLPEFKHYAEKFVLFAKGMPFQSMSSETIRKYISNSKSVHKADFRSAYKQIATSKCFVATALVDVTHPSTVEILRDFRDHRLAKSRAGVSFSRWYYRTGPALADWTDTQPARIREILGASLNGCARLIKFLKF
jgi:hypothetical protein